ncbi:ABC transporter permease [Nonomuraea sp. NPDC026600]|uniref:ABC transporter permease n=1 Tax=Nonomuraea sp. NPDC026600 TaxID=3155363 RepID=UPI003407475E
MTLLAGRRVLSLLPPGRLWPLLAMAGGLLVTVLTLPEGAGLISGGTLSAALALTSPVALAALGGVWAERAGVVNIGLEGMMILGTWGAAYGALQWGPAAGLVLGAACGALGGALHAVTTVTFGVDHIVAGVAINLLAPGVAKYLSSITFTSMPGGGATQSPPAPRLPEVPLPFGLGGLSSGVVLTLVLVPLSWWLLWRTSYGLRLRFCGENPAAAASMGVRVTALRYGAVVSSGALAGLGGAILVLVGAGLYRDGQTGGRGYMGLAAMVFGNWRPSGALAGSFLYGYMDALQLRGGSAAVHALLLVAAVACGLMLLRAPAWRGDPAAARTRRRGIAVLALAAAALGTVFAMTDTLPEQVAFVVPYVAVLVALMVSGRRLRPPAAAGRRPDGTTR